MLNKKFNKWWDSKSKVDLIGNNYKTFIVLAIIGTIGFVYIFSITKTNEKETLLDRVSNDFITEDKINEVEQGDTLLRIN